MYKCLLKNDMNVVTGNFRNNRQNVKVSRAKKILLKKKSSPMLCQETFLYSKYEIFLLCHTMLFLPQ